MSVSAYISEYDEKLEKRLANITSKIESNDNSGALEMLQGIRAELPESAIAQAFDDDGILVKSMMYIPALGQDKKLTKRLRNIHRYAARLEKINSDKSKDHNIELNEIFDRFKEVAGANPVSSGSKSLVDSLLEGNEDDFGEVIMEFDDSPVETATIQSAFKELNAGKNITGEAEESSAINAITDTDIEEGVEIGEEGEIKESSTITEEVGGEGPINLPEETVEEEMPIEEKTEALPTGTGILDNLLAEKTADMTEDEKIELSEKAASGEGPLGDDYFKNLLSKAKEETPSSTMGMDILNNLSAPETVVEETTSNISNVVNNEETTNISNENAVESATSEIESPINEPVKEKKGGKLKGFLKKASAKLLPGIDGMLNKQTQFGGMASNAINAIQKKKAEKQKEKQEAIEKSKIGFEAGTASKETPSDKIASDATAESVVSNLEATGVGELTPETPAVTKQDVESVGQGISSTISETKIRESFSNPEPSKKEQRVANREEKKEARQDKKDDRKEKRASTNVDMGDVEKRLKNIELLLQGPLTVKFKR